MVRHLVEDEKQLRFRAVSAERMDADGKVDSAGRRLRRADGNPRDARGFRLGAHPDDQHAVAAAGTVAVAVLDRETPVVAVAGRIRVAAANVEKRQLDFTIER
ncbi:MAG: hypothetical protein IJL06_03360 [Kiritimatiellae bacterium]|nr:hypothetical protein [Kiritimatiellia bacterium]